LHKPLQSSLLIIVYLIMWRLTYCLCVPVLPADEFALLSPSATAPITQAAVSAHKPDDEAGMEVDAGAPTALTRSTGEPPGIVA
jgi:hypothetical protein